MFRKDNEICLESFLAKSRQDSQTVQDIQLAGLEI